MATGVAARGARASRFTRGTRPRAGRGRPRHEIRRRSAARYAIAHRRAVLVGDAVVALGCAVAALLIAGSVPAVIGAVAIAVSSPVIFGLTGLYGRRFVGSQHQSRTALRTLGVIVGVAAVTAAAVGSTPHRAAFVVVAAGMAVGVVAVRMVFDRRMSMLRRQGRGVTRTVAVGSAAEISRLVDQFAKATEHQYVVVGACVEDDGLLDEDVPLLATIAHEQGQGDIDPWHDGRVAQGVVHAARRVGADAVCVAASSRFTGDRLRALGWALDDEHVALVTALGVTEVADHRIRLGRAGGVALMEIDAVHPTRVRRVLKGLVDRLLGVVILVAVVPIVGIAAIGVTVTSPGSAIYRQERIGRDGAPFTMLKLRTMYIDADRRRDELLARNDAAGPLFKMHDDPRVTPVGRFLRTYSIDELPQLINVIRGEMSLVGPRPALPAEVARYTDIERRRLRTLPGITGLWQVSGRSNLSWDESVRLDLTYVDNWTVGGDVKVLGRTVGAVVHADGSY